MFTACFILLVNCLLCLVFNQMLKSQGKLQETTKPLFRWRIKIQRIHSKVQNLPELQRHILRQVEQTESLVIPCSAWQTAPYNNVVIKLTCAVIIRPYCPSSATAVLKTQVHSCVSFYCEFNDISVHSLILRELLQQHNGVVVCTVASKQGPGSGALQLLPYSKTCSALQCNYYLAVIYIVGKCGRVGNKTQLN